MRKLFMIVPVALVSVLPLAAAQQASTVYQWKDANGVTQYSERPPTGHKAEMRRITQRGQVMSDTPPAAKESPQCAQSRLNQRMLSSAMDVGRDTDGDGKADTPLTSEQRKSELSLAEAAIKVHCTATS